MLSIKYYEIIFMCEVYIYIQNGIEIINQFDFWVENCCGCVVFCVQFMGCVSDNCCQEKIVLVLVSGDVVFMGYMERWMSR